ncbi:RNA-binding domain-containing protein [Lophiostoma macrostomum CBS 122681]|uniref:RNA-binding domain-containing protein n=1 Tax=Lophiostoma macrostomum CBS 122681 TaxID=1314788 RepID=A0A6A6T805_9PLEO|nr:RNA-binding domain-containing protein [Lophiostoma macrostomum CBS 122681]
MASASKSQSGPVAKTNPPNQTLYLRNLPDTIQKDDLKRSLYMLFATHGVVLDVNVMKTAQMRGQAHVVFRDIDSSTQAMRALQGFNIFGKDMSISYAKSKSDTLKKLDGTYQLPAKDLPSDGARAEQTDAQAAVFGSAPAPAKAKPVNAAPEDTVSRAKRTRDEESEQEEDEDEEAAMDVSDSE